MLIVRPVTIAIVSTSAAAAAAIAATVVVTYIDTITNNSMNNAKCASTESDYGCHLSLSEPCNVPQSILCHYYCS